MRSCRIADRTRWLVSAATLGVPLAGLVQLLAALPALLTDMAADDEGFVVLPDGAMRIVGPGGSEADIPEIVATRERAGGRV
jgi:hypothetical protein